MFAIPEELLEQIERGNVLLFVGDGVARDADGRLLTARLVEEMLARCDIAETDAYAFPEAAQAYEDLKGRQALVQLVRDRWREWGEEPRAVHRLLADLMEPAVIATTCIDRSLERAFAAAGRELDVIVGSEDVAFEDVRRSQLYKLRGSLDQVDSLVLTEDDYDAFFATEGGLSIILQGYLARKTILFVGYDLTDVTFKRLYRKMTASLDGYARRAYAFGEPPPEKVVRWCERHGIELMTAEVAVFLQRLHEQLAERRASQTASAAPPATERGEPAPLTQRPYKFLDYYERKDAGLFFGREREIQTLSSMIHAHRLVLLYGASGAGKTSLLQAGVTPRLEGAEPPYVVLTVRVLEEPALAIRRALQRLFPDEALPEGDLTEVVAEAARRLEQTPVIVLDQFEEFFTRFSPRLRAEFIDQLGALYDAQDVPVKVVLSLREDWLASVGEIEERIPEVFRARLRLLPLNRDQAEAAITGPAERVGVSYEPELVERLLDDLAGGDGQVVLPPQLQLVCSALYDDLATGRQIIGVEAYERLGGARGILRQYLRDELARLPEGERALAAALFEELVTAEGTKAVRTLPDLALALAEEAETVRPVVEKLLRARLLRALDHETGEVAYELAHEYLIQQIRLSPEAQRRKEAEELIRQEVETWRRFGALLPPDRLAFVNSVRDQLRLDEEAVALLLRSALQEGGDPGYWSQRLPDEERRVGVLADAAQAEEEDVRQRAARLLGDTESPAALDPLLKLAVQDEQERVREEARASLAHMEGERAARAAERLQSEVREVKGEARSAALQALAVLPQRDVPPLMRARAFLARARPVAGRFLLGAAGAMFVLILIPYLTAFFLGPLLRFTIQASAPWSLDRLALVDLFSGAAFGLEITLLQWLLFRRIIPRTWSWLLWPTVGAAVAWPLGSIAGLQTGLHVHPLLGGLLFGAILGLVVGLAQAFALRLQRAEARRWVAATTAGVSLLTGNIVLLSIFSSIYLVWAVVGAVAGLLFLRWRRPVLRLISRPSHLHLLFLAGILGWGSVAEAGYPAYEFEVRRETLANVPLEVIGQGPDLHVSGLPDSVIVVVEAPSRVMQQLDRADIVATVDLGEREPGTYRQPIGVRVPENVEVIQVRPDSVEVTLESIVTREIPVVVEVRGAPEGGYEMGEPVAAPRTLHITGPETLAQVVAEARVTVALDRPTADVVSSQRPLFYDEQGAFANVNDLELSPEEVEVTVPIEDMPGLVMKPVLVKWEGEPAPGYRLLGIAVEEEDVLVAGPPEVVEELDRVQTEAVDVSGLEASTTFLVELDLPAGVSLAQEEPVLVTVEIGPALTSAPTRARPEIQGLAAGLTATLDVETVEVFLFGPLSALEALRDEDVQIVLDLFGLEAGVYELEPEIFVSLPDVEVRSVTPETLTVTITRR